MIVKVLPTAYQTQKMMVLYNSFFWVWLLLSVLFYLKRDNHFVNKVALLLVSVFGFLIPITNGLVSNNWIWKTYANQQYNILLIDVLWLCLAIVAVVVYREIGSKEQMKSTFIKNPV